MAIPFLTHEQGRATAAIHAQQCVSRARMIGDMTALAALLPPSRFVMNVCRDRYNFAIAFGAAMMRGQTTLLPPSDAPVTLAQLVDDFGDLYVLADHDRKGSPAPLLVIPEKLVSVDIPDVPAFSGDQSAAILFTSGSTGRPQAQAKSWGALVASTRSAGRALAISKLPDATVVATVPLQHSYGLESAVLLCLQHGLVMDGSRPFFPTDIAEALEAIAGPRILVTTPLHLRALVDGSARSPRVDLVLSATSALPVELAAAAERVFGGRVIEIYGCSEAGQVGCRRTAEAKYFETIEGLSLRQDAGRTFVRGAPIVPDEVMLQDIIELESPTRFLLHGRTSDVVNIAGKRSSLAHLNAHLNAIEGVQDGVFVMPEEVRSGAARPIAFVVAPGVAHETIMNALRQRIDAAFLPRPLCFVDELPRNRLGKLPREAVRRLIECADVE